MARILCYLHSFEPGGVERMALRLCQAWREDGADVVLVMGRPDGALRAEAGALPCLFLRRSHLPVAAIETLWMILFLPAIVRRVRPDILFCAGNSYSIVAVLLKLILGTGCPPIVAKISNDLVRRDRSWPWRLCYRAWCRIQGLAIEEFVALSPAMGAASSGELGVSPVRIATIADPVLGRRDADALAQAGARGRLTPPPVGRRFMAIGRLAPQKDFATLLRAFALGADRNDRLTIVGEGPERPRLERLARRLGVADRVALVGHRQGVAEWLARADIFLLSSRFEGLPAVIVEAMAAGLPIVATDCCASIGALVAPARLVPVADVAALARAIATATSFPVIPDARLAAFDTVIAARQYRRLFAAVHHRVTSPGACGRANAIIVTE